MTNEELERLIERTDERIEFAEAINRFGDVGYLGAVKSALLGLQSISVEDEKDMKTTLNKLPNGEDPPKYKVTAQAYFDGEEKTAILQEWWCKGERVQTIEESAQEYFYDECGFAKAPFKVTDIKKI